MLAYDLWIIRLLVVTSFCLLIFLLLLFTLLWGTRQSEYYRRTRITIPRKASSLGQLMTTLLRVGGIIVLVILLILSSIVLLRYISDSTNGIPRTNESNKVVELVAANQTLTGVQSGSALKKALSSYWGYILAGLVILIILIIVLRRLEDSN